MAAIDGSPQGLRYAAVPVTSLWASPQAPRAVDARALTSPPDMVGWLADLDVASARAGLRGLMLGQLELGEPVCLVGRTTLARGASWLQVAAPLQPSVGGVQGVVGWVRAAHLSAVAPATPVLARFAPRGDLGASFVAAASVHLGTRYLWAGMSALGVDCSGLVHLSLRRLGVVVPRVAAVQYAACDHLDPALALPGDLFFFAQPGCLVHHVGIVTGPARMLHACGIAARVVEGPLDQGRLDTLVGAGALSSLLPPASR